jgi:uncharacterized protein (DUF362 family)
MKTVRMSTRDRTVALVRYHEELYGTLQHGISLIGGLDHIRSPVLIKPNICTINDGTGVSVTDVDLVRTVAQLVLDSKPSASLRVVESDSQSKFAMEAFQKFGYDRMVKDFQKIGADVDLVDLSNGPLARVDMHGEYFGETELHEALIRPHSLISVAVAKTHYLTFITGALKNLFGLLPRKDQSFYHSSIDSVIADLARFVTTDLSIVDARTAVEGWNGPNTKEVGAFVIGRSPVSVDSVLTRLLGFSPEHVSHLRKLGAGEIGSLEPAIVGETLESLAVKLRAPK